MTTTRAQTSDGRSAARLRRKLSRQQREQAAFDAQTERLASMTEEQARAYISRLRRSRKPRRSI